jgi:thiaminase
VVGAFGLIGRRF